jgi:AraC-like DNA-binding protein
VPAGCAHTYGADEKDCWTIYWVHFKGATANRIIHTTIGQIKSHLGSVSFNEKRIGLFEDIYTSLERGYGNDNLCYANMCLWHYVSSFLYPDKFIHSENKQCHDVVEQAISYMQKNLSNLITLTDIAQSVNFSVSHFSSLFRKKTGFSPIEYLIHLKIQKACQYLLFTDLRVKEISERLGIEDPYYFSRMFNKLMGVSPNQYRTKRST